MEEVQIHNEKRSLLTTQSLTSLHILCTIALHVDIHLVCCCHTVISWDKGGTVGRSVFVSGLTSKKPQIQLHTIHNLKCEGHNFNTMYKRFHTLILALFHPSLIHSYTLIQSASTNWSDFLHQAEHSHVLMYTPIHHSLMHTSTHLSVVCFSWSGGSASVNKIVK